MKDRVAISLPLETLIKDNCSLYPGDDHGGYRLNTVTQLDVRGTWTATVLKTSTSGKEQPQVLYKSRGQDLTRVMEDLLEQTAKMMNLHINQKGYTNLVSRSRSRHGHDHDHSHMSSCARCHAYSERSDDDDGDDKDDDEAVKSDNDDSSVTSDDSNWSAKAGRRPPSTDSGSAGGTTVPSAATTITTKLPAPPPPPPANVTEVTTFNPPPPPPVSAIPPPPLPRFQESDGAEKRVGGVPAMTRPHQPMPDPVPFEMRRPNPPPAHAAAAAAAAASAPRPEVPGPLRRTHYVARLALINVSWVGHLRCSTVNRIPLRATEITGAAIVAAEARGLHRNGGHGRGPVRAVIKGVRVGAFEIQVRCQVENVEALIDGFVKNGSLPSWADMPMPTIEVEVRIDSGRGN
ncbi:hypothetical protein GMORB2_6649 [Geosmithia morbida]|uniref:Uncharacterized protein n=1 Tax=Geosmithia morbida TaxID=1094350 RepID=A0A9P4YWQ4_9HYPO|nr:uncharacterized protein GMORB2_6649 [Geosmithia morbida]KAF4123101.1 hypothetical protein GMORB2_6649 [Geosmithia morbida]